MYYLVIGKEASQLVETKFKYYYEGDFTIDELKAKANKSYCEEYDRTCPSTDLDITREVEDVIPYNFMYIFKSETPISAY